MEERLTLRDGSEIRIRPIEPDDKGAIVRGFEKLSPTSRYRRFFSPLQRLSRRDLVYLTEVDHHDHEALIAHDSDGEPLGVARYVRGADAERAEVAVAVVDDWQGRGVATERSISRSTYRGGAWARAFARRFAMRPRGS